MVRIEILEDPRSELFVLKLLDEFHHRFDRIEVIGLQFLYIDFNIKGFIHFLGDGDDIERIQNTAAVFLFSAITHSLQ